MTEMDDRIEKFINYLRSLVREGREKRGALSDLRSGLRTAPGQAPRMHQHIVRFLGESGNRSDRWFYVVGAMFGAYPKYMNGNTMGKCFGAITKEGSDSIEGRFIALLGAHSDDVHAHLFHVTGLLNSKNICKDIGLDYYRLLRDLIAWDSPNRYVQNSWARDYYRKINNTKGEESDE